MTPERFEEVERVCQAALDLPATARKTFLDEACRGDPDLRAEVESLLAAAPGAESFLKAPAPIAATPTLTAGRRLGPYEITAPIGAGGMGDVWRARDTRLERDVALKVLPAEALADETARARLVREARLASKLNHPHICTIHEVGEAEGQTYIAMELVEGQPLDARVAAGLLPVDEVVRYGRQLAAALAHAHGRGVVHRDLKSANVVVTPEGQVKVLDFGLAKRLTSERLVQATPVAPASLTAPGVVVGTLAYMAPEQLRGQPADARSDIWALGVVLYEMAAGKRPFEGQTGFEVTAAILSQPVPAVPPSVPAPLEGVIDRCLAKEPGARYQRADEVLAALEAVAAGRASAWPTWRVVVRRHRGLTGAVTGVLALLAGAAFLFGLDIGGLRSRAAGGAAVPPRVTRLAVLPLANLSGDPEQEYLSDGLTQEMIAQLGRLNPAALSVIARTSVMRYKRSEAPVDQIGRELGVDYILEGSAQREAGRIRITVELIKVLDQSQLWANSYERELTGILVLQGEVAQKVAGALALKLLPAERARLAGTSAVNPEAYEAYLKGASLWKAMTPADVDTAERYFELALEKDPSYAAADAGLAWVWVIRQQMGMTLPQVAGPKAKAAALKALESDDSYAGTHEALAAVLAAIDWDWPGAEREYRRALELNPNGANAHAYYAHLLIILGRGGEAVEHSKQAIELDPFNALFHGMYALVLLHQRRFDDAVVAARAALAIDPNQSVAESVLGRVFIAKRMRDEQLALQRQRLAKDPERVAALEQGLAEAGYEGAQRRLGDLLAARYEKAGGVPTAGARRTFLPVGIALRYVDAGDYSRALDWLEKAYEVRDPNLLYSFSDPINDPLRANPRFQALAKRMRLPR
jgi:serine/threonine-protein kinase